MTDDPTTTDRRAGDPEQAVPSSPVIAPAQPRVPLTPEDVRRLTLFKWRYSLESAGFSGEQIGRLLFLKWLYVSHAVRG